MTVKTSDSTRWRHGAWCLLSALWLDPGPAAAQDSGRWHLDGELFLWGADIGGESIAGDIEVPFDEIFDSLESAFMGTLAASRDEWVLAAEVVYLDAASTDTLRTAPVEVAAQLSMETLISTVAAGYRLVNADTTTLHGVFGARYLGLDADLNLSVGALPTEMRSGSEHFWDAIVGLRGEYRFTDDWVLSYYLDIGTGDSDRTWQATTAINYRFERIALLLGYAHLEWEFDERSLVRDLDISGPYAGIQFRLR